MDWLRENNIRSKTHLMHMKGSVAVREYSETVC